MAISNSTERLFFYTLQESNLSLQVSNIQMQLLSATRTIADSNLAYSSQMQDLYYDPVVGYDPEDPELYETYSQDLRRQHEEEISRLTAWESNLEMQKTQVETQLNEITQYKNSCQNMLKKDIQTDFAYGGVSGGK